MSKSRRSGEVGRPPVLVLGLGNLLLHDDAVGLELLKQLADRIGARSGIEFVDGGTQGLALLARIADREALLVLDAIKLGAEPGRVHVLADPLSVRPPRATTAHEANAGELLEAAALIGDLPAHVAVLGVEPGDLRVGIGWTEAVRASIPAAVDEAERMLHELCSLVGHAQEARRCTR